MYDWTKKHAVVCFGICSSRFFSDSHDNQQRKFRLEGLFLYKILIITLKIIPAPIGYFYLKSFSIYIYIYDIESMTLSGGE